MMTIDRIATAVAPHTPQGGSVRASLEPSDPQDDFTSMLHSFVSSTAGAVTHAERVSMSALHGAASAREVVDSTMRAEQMLQTAIALRDKTISAIQEITRMAI